MKKNFFHASKNCAPKISSKIFHNTFIKFEKYAKSFFEQSKIQKKHSKSLHRFIATKIFTRIPKHNYSKYRIARNFRGSKLSWIRQKLIFMNFIIQPFCTVLFIISRILFLRISKKSWKKRKLLASKVSGYTVTNFLYGQAFSTK